MNILHIAYLDDSKYSGVCVVVPNHVANQNKYANTALINVTNCQIKGNFIQFPYTSNFDVDELPKPYNNPDIVVFHEVYRIQYLSIYRMLMKKKIPYVIVPHGELSFGAQKKKWVKKKLANFLLFNKFIKNASAIQVLSSLESDSTHYNVKKIICTNGISRLNYSKRFSTNGILMVYIGRIDIYHKGIDLLLNAVKNEDSFLKKNNCHIEMYGPCSNRVKKKILYFIKKNNLENLVKLYDAIYSENKINKLLNADVFIQTSRFEGMPMGVLEAMSLGLPCLVSKGTTLGEFVQRYNAGVSCDTNVKSIQDALKAIISNKDKFYEYSANSIRLVKSEFDWDVVAKKTVEKYKTLLF